MTDDQILDSVRHGLTGAQIHRPVDDILRRARTRRRTRAITAIAGPRPEVHPAHRYVVDGGVGARS